MSKKINILISNKERPNLHSLFHEYINRRSKEVRRNSHCCDYYGYDVDDYDFETLAQLGLLGSVYPTDDDYDFDDCDIVFPYNNKSKGKNKRKDMNDDDAYAAYWERERMKRNARRAARQMRTIEDADFVEVGSKKGSKKKHQRGSKKNKVLDITRPYSGWEDNPLELEDDNYSLNTPSVTIWFYPNYLNQDDRLEFNTLKDFDDFCCDEGYVVAPDICEDLAYRRISHACLNPQARERGIFEVFAAESYNDMVYEICKVEELSQ